MRRASLFVATLALGACLDPEAPGNLTKRQPFDWTTRLKAFAPKVLFLRGDLNTAAPLEHQQELAAAFASAEIVTMPGVGHEMVWERPDEYLAHTRAYFRSIGFAGGTR
jgi:pimeloyl-ACP methyl ester carboxylesterase